MKTVYFLILTMFLFTGVVFSQKSQPLQPLRMATPIFPFPAIVLGVEETVDVKLQIDRKGLVSMLESNAKRPFFNTAIKDALKEWRFSESRKKNRPLTFKFIFKLLPFDSPSHISSTFIFPNTVEILANRARVTASIDAYMRTKEEFDKRFRNVLELAIPTPEAWTKLLPGSDLVQQFFGDRTKDDE